MMLKCTYRSGCLCKGLYENSRCESLPLFSSLGRSCPYKAADVQTPAAAVSQILLRSLKEFLSMCRRGMCIHRATFALCDLKHCKWCTAGHTTSSSFLSSLDTTRSSWYEVNSAPLFAGLLCDLLWSDPDKDVQGWGENDRGVSFTFGADVVSKFLNRHDLDLICRAHQVGHT